MTTITEPRESQVKRPLGHLQAKIDADLLGRIGLLAAKRTVQEGRRIYPRDVIEEALGDYVPKAERALEKASRTVKTQ